MNASFRSKLLWCNGGVSSCSGTVQATVTHLSQQSKGQAVKKEMLEWSVLLQAICPLPGQEAAGRSGFSALC